ncbi:MULTISPECIES: D-tagatose-bisphosphate aldolase, class II, non-catalytic subunit [unclassified Shinella]|uniref:D-tagatose-bisphosphate aldolase, class II, non-catalytic subunit n=1 Tax=unclassified Shinella TaxID=2643062 RepID=UPI00225C5661|nr:MULTISPECIES: D-tagatose-bisphosphate aldolase, class II, non-catalytic subunit [unclassified Shinella]MCO5139248.1 D-tagatose-bisphosphate aldolase, class II, non-catalytic subunit [Shinella sp.]MDC7256023.1 D-tagatose-bisphosphate aldolase, class II, non-catalytic subunit [Shinella sp. YE25]CAI0338859.1 tagatose-1,6-bisphosphate aldolase 1 subunit KbaZ [Rhizobiaceae bacterium]CAK7257287.1 tagatose-1,6-bisphosphate aldolase 1 subunit KbaZ [Shinella sp. WSC3-e]
MSRFLTGLAAARRAGRPYGIASVCSAHPTVLRAALRRAAKGEGPVLIEATCNQVNQFGGYTGMTPADFIAFVEVIAAEEGVARDKIIFGGDHLGPNPWRRGQASVALEKAAGMVEAYVAAGFTKIHLDASMGCAGEPAALDDRTVAERAAALCAVAEETARRGNLPAPVYILGTEVPVPGGADHALATVEPTAPDAARETIAVHRAAFGKAGLSDAFARVIAFVVQPGVEFGSDNVVAYDPPRAAALSTLLDEEPALVFEAHSTDYQTEEALAALVGDGFPILKVGPGLTFAYREALYALDLVASDIVPGYGDRPLARAMEALMVDVPGSWSGYYHGDETALRIQRHFSYSDRIRYYWTRPEAEAAVAALLSALSGVRIPETVLHQYLPTIVPQEADRAEDILIAAVDRVLAIYDGAAANRP